jgi:hypothetical protein
MAVLRHQLLGSLEMLPAVPVFGKLNVHHTRPNPRRSPRARIRRTMPRPAG